MNKSLNLTKRHFNLSKSHFNSLDELEKLSEFTLCMTRFYLIHFLEIKKIQEISNFVCDKSTCRFYCLHTE